MFTRNRARKIRVWYNAEFTNSDGVPLAIKGFNRMLRPATRLEFMAIRRIYTAFVVLDLTKLIGTNFGQLADYIALTGMAEINLDADLADVPTVLDLFRAPQNARRDGMSAWDSALLKSLYATRQADVVQLSEMQTTALRDIAR